MREEQNNVIVRANEERFKVNNSAKRWMRF